MILHTDIENWFTYHVPGESQIESLKQIRAAAKNLARVILENTPTGADQAAAFRKLRECVMTANAAVALGGRDRVL